MLPTEFACVSTRGADRGDPADSQPKGLASSCAPHTDRRRGRSDDRLRRKHQLRRAQRKLCEHKPICWREYARTGRHLDAARFVGTALAGIRRDCDSEHPDCRAPRRISIALARGIDDRSDRAAHSCTDLRARRCAPGRGRRYMPGTGQVRAVVIRQGSIARVERLHGFRSQNSRPDPVW